MDESDEPRDRLRLASSRRLSLVGQGEASDPVDDPLAYGTPRPALTSIAIRADGDRIEVTATMALYGQVLTGTSAGDAPDRTAIIADATLSALSSLLDAEATIVSAQIVDISGHDVALTIVTLLAEGSTKFLVGSALVRGDSEDATARSVLSALNRRLARAEHVAR